MARRRMRIAAPRDVTATAGNRILQVTWRKPLWTREPQANGYLVQWKGPGEDYHSGKTPTWR